MRAASGTAASLSAVLVLLCRCAPSDRQPSSSRPPSSSPAASQASVLVSDAITGLPLTAERQRTLSSLAKIDDHPLYSMEYSGDYDDLMRFIPQTDVGATSGLRAVEIQACSLFAAMGDRENCIYGRNRDMAADTLPTMVLFTHPSDGQASVSLVDLTALGFAGNPEDKRLLAAPLLCRDGMNASGVTIAKADVPLLGPPNYDPAKPTINFMTAMRVVLDHARSTQEAVELLERHNVAFWSGGHFLVADPTGHSAVLEFGPGRMYVRHNERPWQAATNFLLFDFGGGASPCWRYERLEATLAATDGAMSMETGMRALESVSVAGRTLWSAVYDMNGGRMELAMARRYERRLRFQLQPEVGLARWAPVGASTFAIREGE